MEKGKEDHLLGEEREVGGNGDDHHHEDVGNEAALLGYDANSNSQAWSSLTRKWKVLILSFAFLSGGLLLCLILVASLSRTESVSSSPRSNLLLILKEIDLNALV